VQAAGEVDQAPMKHQAVRRDATTAVRMLASMWGGGGDETEVVEVARGAVAADRRRVAR
jgi:hypothetical protein